MDLYSKNGVVRGVSWKAFLRFSANTSGSITHQQGELLDVLLPRKILIYVKSGTVYYGIWPSCSPNAAGFLRWHTFLFFAEDLS